MQNEAQLDDTGERMVPEFHAGKLIYAEHLVRYRVVQELVRDKVVLDIASGSGYGSAILAETAHTVFGFDADETAVEYAKSRFGAPNITFAVGDATKIPLADDSVDVVITFETIEHIADYEKFMDEIARVLKPDGLAVVSTPNDLEFAEGNHFHLHEFERDELLTLVHRYFDNVVEYYQATWKYVSIDTMDALQSAGPVVRPILNTAPLKEEECLYFYFLCSNVSIDQSIEPMSAVGEHYSERQLTQQFALDVSEIERLSRLVALHEEELDIIKNSKSFQFSVKLASMRQRFRRK